VNIQDRFRFRIDLAILFPILILCAIGIAYIYSSGVTNTKQSTSTEYIRQLLWVIIGLFFFFSLALTKTYLFKESALLAYIILLLLVVVTIFFGRVVNGARSWIGIGDLGIQPSEFLKIASILLLAKQLDHWGEKVAQLKYFFFSGLLFLLPMAVILRQPDLGTALVFIPTFLFMMFIAGAQLRHILYVLGILILVSIFTLIPEWAGSISKVKVPLIDIFNNNLSIAIIAFFLASIVVISIIGNYIFKKKYFYWILYFTTILLVAFLASIAVRHLLKEYQIMRLIVFLDPYIDPKGSGWNIIQSTTAIGSGGFLGKGFLQGTQSHFRFLPEQSTDFIFSIINEESGFLGSLVIFGCFALILLRSISITRQSQDVFASAVSAGICGMVFFHLIINTGMTMGIMPITGIPLLFLSYGGSSLLSAMMAMGILSSINAQRYNL